MGPHNISDSEQDDRGKDKKTLIFTVYYVPVTELKTLPMLTCFILAITYFTMKKLKFKEVAQGKR